MNNNYVVKKKTLKDNDFILIVCYDNLVLI